MSRIGIILADDNPEILEYFSSILSHETDMQLLAAVSSGSEAVKKALELKPDIVLMDIQMETRTAGIQAAKQILQALPATKVIILTILEDDELLFQAYCAGVIDYVIKTDSISEILTSIRNAQKNQLVLRPKYAEKIIAELSRVKNEESNLHFYLEMLTQLSNSEFDVLKCVYYGMTAHQIAEHRYVSLGTIKTQIHSILKKFGMNSMREVCAKLDRVNFRGILSKVPRQEKPTQ